MPGPYFPGYITEQMDQLDSSAKYEVGRLAFDKGRILQYVKFGCGAARYNWVGNDPAVATGVQALILQPNSTHAPLGVAEYGATLNSYGWITRLGGATAKTDETCAKGVGLTNAGAATGVISTIQQMTYLLAMRGHGILVGSPSVSGTYVNVNCL